MGIKMTLHAGHGPAGMKGCGAVGLLDESLETRKVVTALKKYLDPSEYADVTVHVPGTQNEILKKLRERIDQYPDIPALSIHLNMFNGKASGSRVYVYSRASVDTKLFATKLVSKMASVLGIQNGGLFDSDHLYLCRKCDAPVIFLECCFADSKIDVERWSPDTAAKAIAECCKYNLGMSTDWIGELTGESPETSDGTIVTDSILYHVQCGAFKDYKNASDLKHELISKGFDAFIKKG